MSNFEQRFDLKEMDRHMNAIAQMLDAQIKRLTDVCAGCADDALPTNEEIITEDGLSLIQQEVRQAGMKVQHGIEEHLLKVAIRWYVQRCAEAK